MAVVSNPAGRVDRSAIATPTAERGIAAARRRTSERLLASSLVGAAALIAVWLRLRQLSFQTLWWDEGISVYWAHSTLAALTFEKDYRLGPHLPFYFFLLKGWIALVGDGAFQARLLEALTGVVAVPMAYWLGSTIFGRLSGAAAALLIAGSPAMIFYSQEVRMYSLVPVLGMLTLGFTVALLRRSRTAHSPGANTPGVAFLWVLWMLSTIISIYTHYFMFLLLAPEAAILGWYWLMQPVLRDKRSLRPANGAPVVSIIAVGVAFLPWLLHMPLLAIGKRGSSLLPAQSGVPVDFPGFFHNNWETFTVGFLSPPNLKNGIELLFGIFVVASMLRRPWTRERAALVLAMVVPFLLCYAIHVIRPVYWPRYGIFLAPFLLLFVADGVACTTTTTYGVARSMLRRMPSRYTQLIAGALGTCVLAASTGALGLSSKWSLVPQQSVPRTEFSSSDYLPLAQAIGRLAQPGDVMLVGYPWQAGDTYTYGGLAFDVPATLALSASDVSEAASRAIAGGHSAWWMGYYPDESSRQQWQRQDVAAVTGQSMLAWNGDSLLVRFGRPLGDTNLLSRVPPGGQQLTFGSQIALDGYDLAVQGDGSGREVHLTFQWQAIARPQADYTVFVHVLDAAGKQVGQRDSQPNGGLDPTGIWQTGEIVFDSAAVSLPSDARQLDVGWYDQKTGKRLAVPGVGDHVLLSAN